MKKLYILTVCVFSLQLNAMSIFKRLANPLSGLVFQGFRPLSKKSNKVLNNILKLPKMPAMIVEQAQQSNNTKLVNHFVKLGYSTANVKNQQNKSKIEQQKADINYLLDKGFTLEDITSRKSGLLISTMVGPKRDPRSFRILSKYSTLEQRRAIAGLMIPEFLDVFTKEKYFSQD